MADREPWLKKVLARFERPLMRYALSITGDLQRAQDIVQDTFERLLKETAELADDHLPRWLFTVCRHRAMQLHRNDERLQPLPEDSMQQPCDRPGPAAVAEQRQAAALALQLLDRLTPDQRDVIRLKYEHGLSYKEISAVTGHSVSNVGFLIHTALKTIRKELGK